MNAISTRPDHSYPWYVRLIFWLQRRKYGRVLEPAKLWGCTPRVFLALTGLYRAIDRNSSPIEPALRSLVTVRVSQINWCAFCVDINSALALERSVDAAKLADLVEFETSAQYSDREKVALRFAETMTITGRQVDNAMMDQMKIHFVDDQIIELAALVAFQNLSSKFNSALRVSPQGFCQRSSNFPQHSCSQAGQTHCLR